MGRMYDRQGTTPRTMNYDVRIRCPVNVDPQQRPDVSAWFTARGTISSRYVAPDIEVRCWINLQGHRRANAEGDIFGKTFLDDPKAPTCWYSLFNIDPAPENDTSASLYAQAFEGETAVSDLSSMTIYFISSGGQLCAPCQKQSGRRQWRPFLAGLGLGLVAGGVAGWLLGKSWP
jgi:hypothetical protein